MDKRREAGAVARFDLRTQQEVEQPWVDGQGLGCRKRGGSERDGELVRTEMCREITHDSQVSVHVADYCRLEPPPLFVEIQRAHRADIGESEGMVIGFNGGEGGERFDSRV